MRMVEALPTMRRRKATRCRHCDFCRPRGSSTGLRMCAEPLHAGAVVVGDQMACLGFRPAAGPPARAVA